VRCKQKKLDARNPSIEETETDDDTTNRDPAKRKTLAMVSSWNTPFETSLMATIAAPSWASKVECGGMLQVY